MDGSGPVQRSVSEEGNMGGEKFLPEAVISKMVKSRTRYLIPEPLLSQLKSIIVSIIIVVPRVAFPLFKSGEKFWKTDSTENLSYLFRDN